MAGNTYYLVRGRAVEKGAVVALIPSQVPGSDSRSVGELVPDLNRKDKSRTFLLHDVAKYELKLPTRHSVKANFVEHPKTVTPYFILIAFLLVFKEHLEMNNVS